MSPLLAMLRDLISTPIKSEEWCLSLGYTKFYFLFFVKLFHICFSIDLTIRITSKCTLKGPNREVIVWP